MTISPVNNNSVFASVFTQQVDAAKKKNELSQLLTAQEVTDFAALTNDGVSNVANDLLTANTSGFVDASLSKLNGGLTTETGLAGPAGSDFVQMQDYAQRLPGVTNKPNVTPTASQIEDDVPEVSFSDIKIFLGKVRAGTVQDFDLVKMQQLLAEFEHHQSLHHQHNNQSSDSTETLTQQLLSALFSTSTLVDTSNTDSSAQALLDELAKRQAIAGSNSNSNQTNHNSDYDDKHHINKQQLISIINAYRAEKEYPHATDLKV